VHVYDKVPPHGLYEELATVSQCSQKMSRNWQQCCSVFRKCRGTGNSVAVFS